MGRLRRSEHRNRFGARRSRSIRQRHGPELPYGEALAFGDYRCRSDPAGLYCVNYAHQSAARFSDAGVVPFGCLQKVTPPAEIGEKYSC